MAWNGSGGYSKQPKKAPRKATGGVSLFHGIVALVAIVVVGAVAYLFVSNDTKPTVEKKQPKAEKKAIEVVEPEIAEIVEEPAPEPVKPKDPAIIARAEKLRKMTPAERLDFLFEEAKNKPIDLTSTTNRPFATGTEQILSWIFNTRLGDVPPPLPGLPIKDEAHMAEILLANNPALEGDSEKVKAAKEMVELAKQECIKFVKEGGDVTEFLEYYRGQLVQAHQEWNASQKAAMQCIRDEPDIAVEFIKEINKNLAEKGIKPVRIPPKLQEKIGYYEEY